MRLYSPKLMGDGKLIDNLVERGAKLTQMLGGYVVRDHEYALLRVQGAEQRTRIRSGKRIRFLNPFSTYELVRINQQQNSLRFELEADTAGMLGPRDSAGLIQTVQCDVRLSFRVTDPHRLVVANSINSDAGFLKEMTEICSAEFLKLARHAVQESDRIAGTILEFVLLPLGEPQVEQGPIGQPAQLSVRLRSAQTLLAMLTPRMNSLGVTPIEVDILNVKLPEAVRALMTDIVAVRSAQLLEVEAAVLEELHGRTRVTAKIADTKVALMDAFSAKVRDIDYFYGALARYGLDAKSAMLLKTLAGVVGGGEAGSAPSAPRDPMDNLVRMYSLVYMRRVFDPSGSHTAELAKDAGLSEDVQKSLAADVGNRLTDQVIEDFRKLVDKLYFDEEKIDGPTYKSLIQLEARSRVSGAEEEKVDASEEGGAPAKKDAPAPDAGSEPSERPRSAGP